MNTIEERLREMGIELSRAPLPLGAYVPAVAIGNLLFLSGTLPLKEGRLAKTGRVGESLTIDEARVEARQAVINALGILKAHLGSMERVVKCVRITGYVASAPGFTEQHKVLNSASDLIFEIFGERGRHARSAVGVQVLPLNAPLEIEFIFEISDMGFL
jgi:enamine deaminase RidA (YjgF/YER057c/UK114 family)